MRPPTDRALEIRGFMLYHLNRFGVPPTLRELADLAGLAGPSGVLEHIKRLVHHGLVIDLEMSHRGYTLPGWRPLALRTAGAALAERVEASVEACGLRPPDRDACDLDCECCGPDQEALAAWLDAAGGGS